MLVFRLALCALVGSVPTVADVRWQQPDVLQRQHVQQRADLPVWNVQDAVRCVGANLLLGKHLQLKSYLPVRHLPGTSASMRRTEPDVLLWKRLQFQSYLPDGHLQGSPAALRRAGADVLRRQHLQFNQLFLP